MKSLAHRPQQAFDRAESASAGSGSAPPTQRRIDPHVVVIMTPEQAQAAVNALDLLSRMGMGQIDEIAELVRDGFIPMRRNYDRAREVGGLQEVEKVKALLRAAKKELGYHEAGSNGIAHPHVHKQALRAYELQKVIARALTTRPGSGVSTASVDRDGLTARYTNDPAPDARFIQGTP